MSDDTKKDRVYLGPALREGTFTFVRESSDGCISGGILSKDPLPRCDGVVTLNHLKGNTFEVKEDVRMSGPPMSDHSGPANVNNTKYLQGWDRIFGTKAPRGEA